MAKEILKDEIMSDAELDNVAGGNVGELAKLTQLFKTLGFTDTAYVAADIKKDNMQGIVDQVNNIFGELGMGMNYSAYVGNKYTAGGDAAGSATVGMTHNEAVDEIIKRAGRAGDVNGSDFYIK